MPVTVYDFTDEQVAVFKAAFNAYAFWDDPEDREGPGKITPNEFAIILRTIGQNPTEALIEEMKDELDEDKTALEFKEFFPMIARYWEDTELPKDIIESFKAFDPDKDFFVTEEELRDGLMTYGERLTTEELDEMWRIADPAATGTFDYELFVYKIAKAEIVAFEQNCEELLEANQFLG